MYLKCADGARRGCIHSAVSSCVREVVKLYRAHAGARAATDGAGQRVITASVATYARSGCVSSSSLAVMTR